MERVVIAAVIVLVAAVVAAVADRRRPDAPTQARGLIPSQLDRADFAGAAPTLVVVFTSSTCDACADAVAVAESVQAERVDVVVIEASDRADLHARYGIDAVPTMVVADAHGVVVAGFSGPPDPSDVRRAVGAAPA